MCLRNAYDWKRLCILFCPSILDWLENCTVVAASHLRASQNRCVQVYFLPAISLAENKCPKGKDERQLR